MDVIAKCYCQAVCHVALVRHYCRELLLLLDNSRGYAVGVTSGLSVCHHCTTCEAQIHTDIIDSKSTS